MTMPAENTKLSSISRAICYFVPRKSYSGKTRLHRWNDFNRLIFSLGHDFCGNTSGDPKNLLIIGEEGKMRVASGCKASALRRTIFPDGYDADGIRTYKLTGTCNSSLLKGAPHKRLYLYHRVQVRRFCQDRPSSNRTQGLSAPVVG